jgi:hypothetical protein
VITAYLDIETAYDGRITLVGIYRADKGTVQFVGGKATPEAIAGFLEGTECLVTYNGHRFDLPRIRAELGLDLRAMFPCRDLMYDCWSLGLKGGFKKVEERLGVARDTRGVDGLMAMALWEKYVDLDDTDALALLLAYNREDVENMPRVLEKLEALGLPAWAGDAEKGPHDQSGQREAGKRKGRRRRKR